MVSRIDNAFSFQQQALNLRAYRQEILAGNIANADTPNYKARDFDFSTALKSAVAGRADGGLAMARTNAGHLSGNSEEGPVHLLYRKPVQASVDGNTVEMDTERAEFAENAFQYQAGLSFITHQVRMLSAAMQSQSS